MFVLRRVLRLEEAQLRYISKCAMQRQVAAEPITIPNPDNEPVTFTPKIEKLVTDISQLTLIEVSELSSALKQRLNLPDAPMMAVGAVPAAAAQAQDEEEEAPKAVKVDFTVKLMKYDEKQKVPLIKELKNVLEGMNLVQAKKFVEGAPAIVKADIPKEEAEKLKETLEKVGAEIVID